MKDTPPARLLRSGRARPAVEDATSPMTRTRLLVSVVDAAEACLALDAGADLIDIKDPRNGSLGAADAAAIRNVVGALQGTVPISVALGEMADLTVHDLFAELTGIQFAKLGMAGCGPSVDWPDRWDGWLKKLPGEVKPVAVVYADWEQAAAPEPAHVLLEASRRECAAVLVDTWEKSHGGLLDYWTTDFLAEFIASVQRCGMLAVLGGSLTIETIPAIAALAPDYIAVRGAACDGGRSGRLNPSRVRQLVRLLIAANDA